MPATMWIILHLLCHQHRIMDISRTPHLAIGRQHGQPSSPPSLPPSLRRCCCFRCCCCSFGSLPFARDRSTARFRQDQRPKALFLQTTFPSLFEFCQSGHQTGESQFYPRGHVCSPPVVRAANLKNHSKLSSEGGAGEGVFLLDMKWNQDGVSIASFLVVASRALCKPKIIGFRGPRIRSTNANDILGRFS